MYQIRVYGQELQCLQRAAFVCRQWVVAHPGSKWAYTFYRRRLCGREMVQEIVSSH